MANEGTAVALEAFAADQALAQLEEAASKFNLFEAIGATHKELWHSDFLAFLLDPGQNHGLGDEFARRLLPRAVPELAAIDSWASATVRREYRYTDILIEDEQSQVSVIIENKVWSAEGPGQLTWYWDTITAEHPKDWDVYGIFLTPHGLSPIAEEDRKHYHVLTYGTVMAVLDEVLQARAGGINQDVELVIRHYSDMLRRFIVGDADAETLARELYFKHKQAVKLMNPSLWKSWIRSYLEQLIQEAVQLKPEVSNLEYVRFRVAEWDNAEGLKAGTGKETSYPMLFFDFYNYEDSLTLYLWIGPPMPADVRAQLLSLAEQNIPPFCKPMKQDQWYYAYQLKFLTQNDYATRPDVDLRALIETKWHQFTDQDLPAILQALKAADWFWNAPGQPAQP